MALQKSTVMEPALPSNLTNFSTKMVFAPLKKSKSRKLHFICSIYVHNIAFFLSLYKCFGVKDRKWMNEDFREQFKNGVPREEIWKNQACAKVEFVEKCTQQLHPSCMGFVQRQLPFWAQAEAKYFEETPECFKSYLAK